MSTAAPAQADPLLVARGMSRTYPGVRALDDVDLEARAGEVLAVVGENGAGKSTLMRLLAGVEMPHSGAMQLDGAGYAPASVHDAIDAGVVLIHQELRLAGNLDIAGNISLGREPRRRWPPLGIMDRAAMERTARTWMDAVGLHEPVRRRVEDLSIGRQQLVEIAKALSVNARVVIMDEPTSSLTLRETERLFEVVRDLKARGVAVVYISHRLGEVQEIADRVLVLRDGRVSGHLDPDDVRTGEIRDRVIRLMVGRDVAAYQRRASTAAANELAPATALEVRGARTRRHPRATVEFAVGSGEIVGIAGLVGAGRTELLEGIFGITPLLAGTITVGGAAVARDVRSAIASGLALAPEDRKGNGLFHEWAVRHNVSLVDLRRHGRCGWLHRARERERSAQMQRRLRIGAAGDMQLAGLLSGGNQQKVVLGRWLTTTPRVLLLDEPTRGVDVGARSEIYRIMEELAAGGAGILFASSDLEEILGMSDRVLVMRDGAISGELARTELSEEAVMHLATAPVVTEGAA